MSRLSDALGVPEGKLFEFRGAVYVIKGNRRYFKHDSDEPIKGDSEKVLARMLDNTSEIKVIPTRYKRKEPEIVEAHRIGDDYVPEWVPRTWLQHALEGHYIVQDAVRAMRVYSPEEFESTFEEVE